MGVNRGKIEVMNGRHVAIALLLLSGCRQTRCVEPSVDCLDVAVDTRDAGGGVTAIRIVGFSSTPACTQDLRLYCQIGVWDGALNEGTFRNFYFDATTAGTVSEDGDEFPLRRSGSRCAR